MRVRSPDERSPARGRRIMTDVRRCIGSARFAIEPHDALVAEFPSQPSQKDGLGRMCKVHWNAYTAGLARDAKARMAAAATDDEIDTPVAVTEQVGTVEASVEAVTAGAATSEPKRRRRAKPANVAGG